MSLASAASLDQGLILRALYPVPSHVSAAAIEALGTLAGLRIEDGLVLLDATLTGPVVPGAPILDASGRVVGIAVRQREKRVWRFTAADHISDLVRRATAATD